MITKPQMYYTIKAACYALLDIFITVSFWQGLKEYINLLSFLVCAVLCTRIFTFAGVLYCWLNITDGALEPYRKTVKDAKDLIAFAGRFPWVFFLFQSTTPIPILTCAFLGNFTLAWLLSCIYLMNALIELSLKEVFAYYD